jgi:hypothetical protein
MSLGSSTVLIKFMRSKSAVALFSLVSLGLLVYGGRMAVLLASDHLDTTPGILYDIGAKPVTLEKLKAEAIDHNLTFYWLGEKPGKYMTIDHKTPGVVTLAYTDQAEEKSVVDSPEVSVSTHVDEAHYVNAMNGAVHVATDDVVTNSRGDVVIINSSLLNEMVVKLKGSDAFISITYETRQSEESLVRDSERLALFDPAK